MVFTSIQDQQNYDFFTFFWKIKIFPQNWEISAYFIAFLVVSHQYKTNKTMNFSLFFLKNGKTFPQNREISAYFIAFWWFHINIRPTKLWIFHFFLKNRKIFPQNWEISAYFIAFLVLSRQYKTNKTMNVSLFFGTYFHRTEKYRHILLLFWWFQINTRPTKLWTFY